MCTIIILIEITTTTTTNITLISNTFTSTSTSTSTTNSTELQLRKESLMKLPLSPSFYNHLITTMTTMTTKQILYLEERVASNSVRCLSSALLPPFCHHHQVIIFFNSNSNNSHHHHRHRQPFNLMLKGMTDVSALQCDTLTVAVDRGEGREASSLIGSAAFQFQGPSV
ncbi:hypothetical protein TYRP_011885 [Tyrophagus putrescentiae]|nr:hypothetical protein TYRP_011885 [Tyrophagus putrescentiae]